MRLQAVLFLTEVDNMSYAFGLGEREKERVDTHGHIILNGDEARFLKRTKPVVVVVTVGFTLFFVQNGALAAAQTSGHLAALLFKLGENQFTSEFGLD